MGTTPERDFSPPEPPSGDRAAANALLALLADQQTHTAGPKSILRANREPSTPSPRRTRAHPKRRVVFDNSPTKEATMPPKRPRTTPNGSHTAAVKRRQAAAGRGRAITPKPRAAPKPRARNIAAPSSPAVDSPRDDPASPEAEEDEASDHHQSQDEDSARVEEEVPEEVPEVQEVPAADAAGSFALEDAPADEDPFEEVTIQADVKIAWHNPPLEANKFKGIGVPGSLTKFVIESLSSMKYRLQTDLERWLVESKKRVQNHLKGYGVEGIFSATTIQCKKNSVRAIALYSGELDDESSASDSRQLVTDLMRGIERNKGQCTLLVVHRFRLRDTSTRVIPGRYQTLVTPSSSGRLSLSRTARDSAVAAAAEAEENDPFSRRSSSRDTTGISRLADSLGLSSSDSAKKRSREMRESVLAQSEERLTAYTQLARLLQCQDPNRCPNNKRGTHGASYCFVKEDNTHLHLNNKEVMAWADKIEKRQERASLEHIPQSVYDRAMVRLLGQKVGGPEGVANALSTLGPEEDPLAAILGRPGKANVSKPSGGVASGNIIINGGGGGVEAYLPLFQALASQLGQQTMPQQPYVPPYAPGQAYTLPTGPSVVSGPSRVTPPPLARQPMVLSSSPVVPDEGEGSVLLEDFLVYLIRRKARDRTEKAALRRLSHEVRDAGLLLLRDLAEQPDGWYTTRAFDEGLGSFVRQCVKDFLQERASPSVPSQPPPPPPAPAQRQPPEASEGTGEGDVAVDD